MGVMRTEPQPSDREVFAGLVERVTYQNAENGFCVIRVKARGHRDLVTVVGHAAVISAGEWITASGDWTNDRTHGLSFLTGAAAFVLTSTPARHVLAVHYTGRPCSLMMGRKVGGSLVGERHTGFV
jgi:exodeoxyribonuclease V alpha subunit